MNAKEYLNKNHPTAIKWMDGITKLVPGIDNFSAEIIDMLEDYAMIFHQVKSKEEAGESIRLLREVLKDNYDISNTHEIEPSLRDEIEDYLSANEYWDLVCAASDYLHRGNHALAKAYMIKANKIRYSSQNK